jgi:hypothetical protein
MTLTLDDITPDQRDYFQRWAQELKTTPEELLSQFRRDPWEKDAITGPLPHCGLFGLMESDARCRT